jgi:hypothetical protein
VHAGLQRDDQAAALAEREAARLGRQVPAPGLAGAVVEPVEMLLLDVDPEQRGLGG